jgi:tRNA threonylcarbamoyladenosine biosynthesis protein TsaE
MKKILTTSAQQTKAIARKLSAELQAGDILCLTGDLGSGKTTFVQGLAEGLNVNPLEVNSPTFVLMNIYEGRPQGSPKQSEGRPQGSPKQSEGRLPVYHFDLYRLADAKEISKIGYEEFFYGKGITVIEWADKLGDLTPETYLGISFQMQTLEKRALQFAAHGKRYRDIVARL